MTPPLINRELIVVSRFSPAALAEYQALAVSPPLKYAYTPDYRLGPNAVEYRVPEAPVRLIGEGAPGILLAFLAGYLTSQVMGSGVGKAFKGGIAKRIGG